MRDRRAFTLIEMMAVLVIIALLAMVAGLVLAGPASVARMSDVTDRIEQIDRQARDYAQRFDCPTQLTFNLTAQSITIQRTDDQSLVGRTLHVPAKYRIERIRFAGQSSDAGETLLSCSTHGSTPSYGLVIAGPQQRVCFLVAGLTGRFAELANEQSIDETFKALADAGHDAD